MCLSVSVCDCDWRECVRVGVSECVRVCDCVIVSVRECVYVCECACVCVCVCEGT